MGEESIFAEALLIAQSSERAAYLERVCAGDADLRRQVEALLSAHGESNVLDRPAAEVARTGPYQPAGAEERPGMAVGPYKLLQELGEGGFGVVFLAEQTEPVRRQVAVKIIKPGMDSKQILARFEQERQALALMDHPNIAKFLDAGTTESGRPYFVMELVKGVPITTFCDQNRLNTRQRLELFTQVCAAIAHAHTKGIIHRDIKPSNVLVALYDGKPVPKVIDFGIAKAIEQRLSEQTLFTQVGQVIGTFEYMSPEQATTNQLDVDTRSDVYALGVLLYELLTGFTPLDRDRLRTLALDEMLRAIREEEPQRPSTKLSNSGGGLPLAASYRGTGALKLTQSLRGELDWIALKALEKDRSRRYQSATGLAEDVGRYLRDEQVIACPPSWSYRAGKFLRKHKASFTLAGTAAALLLVGAVVSGCLAWWAINERKIAQQERNSAQQDRDKAREERDTAQRERDAANAARLQARRAHYAQTMTLIAQAWEANDTRRVAKLLDALRPAPGEVDLRGFEWHYWDRQLHQERRTLVIGDVPSAPHFAFDNHLSTLSADGTRVAFALVSANAKYPYVRKDKDKAVVKVVDTATGKEVFSKEGGFDIRNLSLNRNGTRLAFQEVGERRRVWDVDRNELLGSFRGGDLETNLLDPDGRYVLMGSNGRIWDSTLPIGDRIRRIARPEGSTRPEDAKGRLSQRSRTRACFSSDGSRLAMVEASSENSKTVSIWDVATGARRASLAVEEPITSLAFSPDGKRLYGTDLRRGVVAWDGADGDTLKVVPMRQNNERVEGSQLTCSPDGKSLAVWRQGSNGVRILDAHSGFEIRALRSLDTIRTAAFSKDGKRLITLGYSGDVTTPNRLLCKEWDLEVTEPTWDQSEDKPLPVAAKEAKEVTIRSRDGERQVSYTPGNPNVTVRDQKGKVIRVFEEHQTSPFGLPGHPIWPVAFSPNGRFVMSCDFSRQLAVWDPDTGKILRRFPGVVDPKRPPLPPWIFYSQPVISPDGRVLFVREGKEIKAVNFDDLTERFSLGEVNAIWFSPDGKRLLAYRRSRNDEKETVPGGIQLWDIESKTRLSSQMGNVALEALAPDGGPAVHANCRYLLVQEGEGSTAIWDIQTLEKRLVLKGSPAEFEFLRFSPDGTRLATQGRSYQPGLSGEKRAPTREELEAGEKSTPGWLVWDVHARKVLFRLPGPERVMGVAGYVCPWIAFSPDNQRIATTARTTINRMSKNESESSISSSGKVWDATTGHELVDLKATAKGPHFKSGPHMADFWLSFSPDGARLSVNYRNSGMGTYLGRDVRTSIPDTNPGIPFTTWDATPREKAKR